MNLIRLYHPFLSFNSLRRGDQIQVTGYRDSNKTFGLPIGAKLIVSRVFEREKCVHRTCNLYVDGICLLGGTTIGAKCFPDKAFFICPSIIISDPVSGLEYR